MFHIGAYFLNAAAPVLADMAAVTDPVIAISNGHFLPQEQLNIGGAMIQGANVTEAQINSPKIRQVQPCFVRPVQNSLGPGSNYNFDFFMPNDLTVNPQEELQMLVTGTGAAQDYFGLVELYDQIDPVPAGDMFKVKFTVAVAPVAKAWTVLPYTLFNLLPAGTYQMLWSEYVSATGIAHRWVFDQQVFRPGFPSLTAETSRHPDLMYKSPWGVMGKFYTYSLPRLEVLCDAADATALGFMAVVRTGPSAAESL